MKNMRLTLGIPEIINAFKHYQNKKISILLWQNVEGFRVKANALLFDINAANELRFLSIGQAIPFSIDKPLYIYGEYKSLLFKATIKALQGGELTINMPKMLRFAELRNNKRFDISSVKNCLVTLRRKNSKEENEFIYKLHDISKVGMSFLMGQDSPFKEGDLLQITHIQNDQIPYLLHGKIVHTSPYVNSQGVMDVKISKVGVKFIENFLIKDLAIYKKVLKELK